MRFDLVLRGGEVASSESVVRADVGIVGERIAEIGDLTSANAATVLDCAGLTVLPGIIDTQVHFREPGMEHKENLESGSRAAVFGGATTVFEMPNTDPPTTSPEALRDKLRRAEGRAWCNYAFFIGATPDNAGRLAEYEMLPGTPGIKVFMGSSTGSLLVASDDALRKVLRSGKRRIAVHAEDHARLEERKRLLSAKPTAAEHPLLRDAECARKATDRLIALCRETGRPVHILHVSTADELPMIRAAKEEGLPVTAEVTPQHLWFAAPDAYRKLGSLVQMNPPIRTVEHREAIRKALAEGLFDVVGSDHAPHTFDEKTKPYPQSPSGMPGVQTLVPVMLTLAAETGILDIKGFVALACEGPARIYGIQGKGRVAPGYDADLCAVDLNSRRTFDWKLVQSKCGWSAFEGESLTGWPVHVVVGGTVAIRNGAIQGKPAGNPCRFDWK